MRGLWFALVCAVMLAALPVWAQNQAVDTELTGAVIVEQNVTFAVVVVKKSTLNDKALADGLIQTLEPTFGDIPVVLMVQDVQGTASFYGRKDIAEFLSNVPLENIPWKKYTLKEVRK